VSTASSRYAQAVFELAREEGQVEAWASRLQSLQTLLADPDVRRVLANPSISVQDRLAALQAFGGEALGSEGLNLARLLVESGRVAAVDGIVREFQRLADEAAGRVRATATTAVELSGSGRKELEESLSNQLGKEVRLDLQVDPAIVGGLVLQVGDRLLDASVATRLQQLRRRLALV
jgi:F-type H+-transporting ATPase subunit delta